MGVGRIRSGLAAVLGVLVSALPRLSSCRALPLQPAAPAQWPVVQPSLQPTYQPASQPASLPPSCTQPGDPDRRHRRHPASPTSLQPLSIPSCTPLELHHIVHCHSTTHTHHPIPQHTHPRSCPTLVISPIALTTGTPLIPASPPDATAFPRSSRLPPFSSSTTQTLTVTLKHSATQPPTAEACTRLTSSLYTECSLPPAVACVTACERRVCRTCRCRDLC